MQKSPMERKEKKMTKRHVVEALLLGFLLAMTGCGGLRFAQVAPEAKQFHPKRIAVFPIEIWNHKNAIDSRKVVEQIVAASLVERKWFAYVMESETFSRKISEDETLNRTMTEYMSKLRELTFSDPDLSGAIGKSLNVDAFLILTVDEWRSWEENNNKMAKVGLYMELYDAASGKLMWKAGHALQKENVLLKPNLTDMVNELARKMISYMPH